MRLQILHAHGFRSIARSLSLYLRPQLTCLIGANEHGKSNLLEAVNLLDSGGFDTFDRHVRSKDDDEPRLRFSLSLGEDEKETLSEALHAELAALTGGQTDDQAKSVSIVEGALKWLKRPSATSVAIELRADNSRHLGVGRGVFNVSPGKTSHARPVRQWTVDYLPSVQLFEPPAELADSVTLAELKAQSNPPFVGLLKLAGVWDEIDVLFEGNNNAHRLKQHAGRTLTRKLRRIWSQGAAHTFRFDESGNRLHVSIEDPTTFDMPSRRSLGLKSFLSFYLTLYAQTEEIEPEGFLLLFDEPGIHLHPQGQKDLLRELRRLAARNQIVYTTHSPFMIDRNDPAATILVRKDLRGPDKGTRVIAKAYGDNWSGVNAALGIAPADSLFPADRILLVEGRSDRLYIARYMSLCQTRTKADLNELSIVDSERREQMEDYARLLLSSDREIVVLADGDQGGDDLAKRIKKLSASRRSQVKFIDLRELYPGGKEVSIEDFLSFDSFTASVQKYVTDVLKSTARIDPEVILAAAKGRTLGRATASYLAENGILANTKKFSKTTVADIYCGQQLDRVDPESPMGRLCQRITDQLGLSA